MIKDLKGWEQPEKQVPGTVSGDGVMDSGTGSSKPGAGDVPGFPGSREIDIEIPDAEEGTDKGPEFLAGRDETGEDDGEKKPAAGAEKKHRLAKPPKRNTVRHGAKKEEKQKEHEQQDTAGGGFAEEDVLMMGGEPEPEGPAPGAETVEELGRGISSAGGMGRTRRMLWDRRRHSYAAPLGLAFIILALIGLVSLVISCVNLTMNIVYNTEEKSAFEWKIYPLLMFDPAAFDSPTQLDEVFVLKTALWKTLLENRTKYSYNDTGMLMVPASDLDVAAKSLYGNAVKLSHQSFSEGYEFFYIYDEKQNAYMVPVQGQTAHYTPKVISIAKNEGVYTLLVGYVPPNDLWNINTEGNMTEPSPSKYMYYDLAKTENGYNIIAVRKPPREELPEDLDTMRQPQLNQTRYDEYVESFMAEENAAGSDNTSEYVQAVGRDSLEAGEEEPQEDESVSGESGPDSAESSESSEAE